MRGHMYLLELDNMRMHQASVVQNFPLDILCDLQEIFLYIYITSTLLQALI